MAEKNTLIYGLLGFPLTHSFSQTFFNQKFESENINAKYLNFEIPDIGDIMEVVAEHPTLMGLNVTIPYKEQVLPYLDDIDSEAQNIGAVNVIKIIRKKNNLQFKGYNSDVIGFSDSLRPLLTPERNKALVLGTGGAAKAISYGLNKLGVSPTYVSRKPKEGQLTYDDLTPEIMAEYKVIVNTTPLGMYPHVDECPNIPYELLSPAHLCYDLIYNPDTTLFMKKAATYGAEVKNGLEMLLLQAFVSWKIWNDL
jgi:shikimate dehydrogenase